MRRVATAGADRLAPSSDAEGSRRRSLASTAARRSGIRAVTSFGPEPLRQAASLLPAALSAHGRLIATAVAWEVWPP